MVNFMKNTNIFLIGLTVLSFIISLSIPSVGPLLHPDSSGYIQFAEFRTAFYPVFLDVSRYFGITINQIPILQISIFSLSLFFLLKVLLEVTDKKVFIFLYVVILIGNIWLTSLHKYILTESLYISLNLAAVSALINFFLKGSLKYILIFSFMVGLAIGVRPSGVYLLVLFPIILLAAKNYFKNFQWKWIVVLIIPILITQLAESALYYKYHGTTQRGSLLPTLVFGKGATMKGDFVFSGSNKEVLEKYSDEVDLEFGKVAPFLEKMPYFWLKTQSLPNYEIYAQFNILRNKRDYYAKEAGVSKNELMMELGKQRIFQSVDQWIKNSIYYYVGSWGLRVTTFPPFVDDYNNWVLNQSDIPLNNSIKYLPLKGDLKPSSVSMIVFPMLLLAGMVSGIIGLVFLVMLLQKREISLLFILSGLLSIMVHGSIIFASIINVATPRFTVTQFPLLLLVFLFVILWATTTIRNWSNSSK